MTRWRFRLRKRYCGIFFCANRTRGFYCRDCREALGSHS